MIYFALVLAKILFVFNNPNPVAAVHDDQWFKSLLKRHKLFTSGFKLERDSG